MSGCGQKVVIDLDFDGRMAEKDVRSLAQQLTYCYSSNIKAAQPCHLHLLGAAGTLKELVQRNCAGLSNWHATVSEAPYHEHFKNARDRLVYLTADSDHELEALDPDAIYVIGGIVDRNKFKGLCYDRAREHGVATARLPIKKYVQLGSSAVLTVNHVLQILVEWLQHRDWRRAFESTIPERKRAGYVKGGGGSGGSGAGESVGDEGARRSSEGGSRGNGEGEEDEDGSPPSPASWPEVGQGAEGGSGGATAAVATAGDGNADAGGPAVKRARTENGGDGASDKPPSDAT